LRFVDRRIEHAADLTLIDAVSTGRRHLARQVEPDEARAAIRKVKALRQDMSVVTPLRALVRAVLYRPLAEIAPALLAYADALEMAAQWSLAADVYNTVIRLANAPALRDMEPFRTIRINALPQRRRARQLAVAVRD